MIQDNKNAFRSVMGYFDKLEDNIRSHLSRYPILYTIIGSVAIVLFWRGVWHTADILQAQGGLLGVLFYEPTNLVISVLVLLAIGLFVSYFIGDTILMSGLKREKKVADRTEREVQEEEGKIQELRATIREMKKEVDEIKDIVVEEHKAQGQKRD